MVKQILCGFGVDIDAVAGWLGSYGGEDSPSDIQRGMFAGEVGTPRLLKLFDKFKLKASWNLLESANKGLFCQLITVPLFKDHKILTQVSGHGSHTIKLLPSLTITEEDCNWIETAFDSVIASSHKVPGAIWSLGKTLVDNAVRKSA